MPLSCASVSACAACLLPRVPSRLPRARRRAASASPRAASDAADDADFDIPDAPPPLVSREDRQLLRDLQRRDRRIQTVKLQRSRVSVGDYVSPDCTKFRAERHALQRDVARMRREMDDALAAERYDHAAELRDALRKAERRVTTLTRKIQEEVDRGVARCDEEL